MADWASLLGALNGAALSAFGREVAYRPQSGGENPIRAIFQPARESEENSPETYAVVFVQFSEIQQAPRRGDLVVVGDFAYNVFQVEAGGSAGANLAVRIHS